MRANVLNGQWACLCLALMFTTRPAPVMARDDHAVDVSKYVNAVEAVQAGEELENSRQWVEAITLYEALRQCAPGIVQSLSIEAAV